jgi:hypothetical protein
MTAKEKPELSFSPNWGGHCVIISMLRAFLLVLLAPMATSLASESAALTPGQLTEVERVGAITVPVPGEFFAAIDKVGPVAWGQYVRALSPPGTASRPQIALMLGTLVADGYVAVEARDSQAVKNIGKEILGLAKRLNVSQSVLARANSINDFADAGDWSALCEELEATQNEVKLEMAEQNDDELVTLVTVGAWLRGMDLASGWFMESPSDQGAKLLRQPAIIEFLLTEIDGLPGSRQVEPLVAATRSGLVACREAVQPEIPGADDIQTLHDSTASLIRQITGTSPASPEVPPPATPTPSPALPTQTPES